MCGILAYTTEAFVDDSNERQFLQSCVASRGPNHWGSVEARGMQYDASVLALRDPFTPQPVKQLDESGSVSSVLCFNGQIYDLPENESQDTQYFGRLCELGVPNVFRLEGEFAFVYYSKKENRVYFGRDRFGRRSLLYKVSAAGELIVSSVAGLSAEYTECEGQGTYYSYSLSSRLVERHVVSPEYDFHVSRERIGSLRPVQEPNATLALLRAAVGRRLVRPESLKQSPIAVLFSGGLDCTIIAALLDDVLPAGVPIDLLNVAFENKRTGTLWDTPDRLLARRSLQELEARGSENRFALIEINVPYEKTCEHTDKVRHLMHPNATVMDLSIALAFYFASEPQRQALAGLHADSAILFSGLGADELFAGYSRHLSSALDEEKLAAELELDFNRLPHRNLGRDDRICASWGREVRYPFLDSGVVTHAMHTPLNLKTDGTTTKVILRDVAHELGLGAVCSEKKRAIQFGARSAKMDPGSGRLKGHNTL